MTDCETTPVPALDFAAWDRQEREHITHADDLLPANKTALFDALAASNITVVVVTFDGYGDSGQIENIEARAGDEIVNLPPGAIEIARPVWGSNDIDRQSLSIHDAIEALVYCFLGQTHDGWETAMAPTVTSRSMSPTGPSRSTTTSAVWNPIIRSMCFEEAAMGHPYHRALSSVRKWGGAAEDYLPIHQWFDESKAVTADFRHRALRHHAEGIFMAERFFGTAITISTGRVVPVRLIGEQHVREDLGFIPSFADWVRCIRPEPWMGRAQPIHRDVDPFAAAV